MRAMGVWGAGRYLVAWCSAFHVGARGREYSTADLVGAPILQGLLGALAKDYGDEPVAAVERALEGALRLAAEKENVALSDVVCERDYSQACPQGWADLGDGATCMAPTEYEGPCPQRTSFGGLTPAAKSATAVRCSAEFPCVDDYPQDFGQLCPVGWALDYRHDCLAPDNYTGPCEGRKKFGTLTELEKRHWGVACGVAWPPREAAKGARLARTRGLGTVYGVGCLVDYSGHCPRHWAWDGGLCRAPPAYAGVCAYVVDAAKFTPRQKHAFAEHCSAPWPCSREAATVAP
uniref:CPW-WPC domain-containing protein n=1 Tax=Pyrodinium bahamense TaxID=73915 RepID=A0A7R9ZZK0_9DINO|mmetsp:Transcript_16791/g.46220  ORF Transcript_16791/g.46220 Transcript_16791/m.46220 type:complete len:291 (+) Transcript_16791:35-907(+)